MPKSANLHIDANLFKGCGFTELTENGYGLGQIVDTRRGYVGPGPLLVADISALVAGYLPITSHGGWCLHNNVNILVTHNGTNTKVYRQETGAWALKETVNSALATDVLSFTDSSGNATLIVGYGNATAFRYSIDDGANWTASNRTGNTKYLNYGIMRSVGRLTPQCDYVVNPNLLYQSTSMINGGAAANTGTQIGDASTTNELFTSIVEDITGVEYFGKEINLYSVDSAGAVYVVAGPFAKPTGDAGGTPTDILDRKNFQNPQVGSDKAIYFHAGGGYDILRVAPGVAPVLCGPRWAGPQVIPMTLPVTAMAIAGDWLLVATGTDNITALRTRKFMPFGGAGTSTSADGLISYSGLALAGGTTGNLLFAARWDGEKMVYHGSLLDQYAGTPFSGMWFDSQSSYLFLTGNNDVQKRCYFAQTDPMQVVPSGGMTGGTPFLEVTTPWRIDYGMIGLNDYQQVKCGGRFSAVITGGGASGALVFNAYPYDTYSNGAGGASYPITMTFTTEQRALYGQMCPSNKPFRLLLITLSSVTLGYTFLWSADLEVLPARVLSSVL